MSKPVRTGMLLIGCSYSAPWDINPWCDENLTLLRKLDKHNLTLRRLGNPSGLVLDQWAELSDDVEHLVNHSAAGQPLLVYVNLHGVVTTGGQPCLILEESRPLETETWLPLDQLVKRLRQALPEPRPMIIALECGRESTLPLPGSDQHTFADAVRSWFATLESQGHAHGLSLLISQTSPYPSLSNADLGGDLFTVCLAEALSGQCDAVSMGGNGNHRIEWSELRDYMHAQVELRSLGQHGWPQGVETLSTADAAACIAWTTSLTPAAFRAALPAEPTTAQLAKLNACWKRIAELQTIEPWRKCPDHWGWLTRSVVAWEQSLYAGKGGLSRAGQLERQTQRYLTALDTQLNSYEPAEKFESDLVARSAQLWQALAGSPSLLTIKTPLESEASLQQLSKPCAVPVLVNMLGQPELAIWHQPQRLKRWAQLQSRIEQVRLMQFELPPSRQLVQFEMTIDHQRRQLEDATLADTVGAQWDESLANLETILATWQQESARVRAAVKFNEQMLASLPHIHQVVDLLDSNDNLQPALSARLTELVDQVNRNRDMLARSLGQSTPPGNLTVNAAPAKELLADMATRWQQILATPTEPLAQTIALEALLSSGWLPLEIGSVEKAIQLRLTTRQRLMHSAAQTSGTTEAAVPRHFGVHHRKRLHGWLNWNERLHASPEPTAELESEWHRMHLARLRAGLGLDASVAQAVRHWHALRTQMRSIQASGRWLEDFWKLPLLDGQDYYAALSRHAAQAAAPPDRTHLEQLISRQEQSLSTSLALIAQWRPVWNEHLPPRTVCQVVQREALPEGIATVRIVHADQTNSPASPVAIGSTSSSQPQRFTLPVTPNMDGAQNMEGAQRAAWARLDYRGHRFQSQFEVHPRIGHATLGQLPSAGPSRITVQATDQRQRARMLILDCSASMQHVQLDEDSRLASSAQSTRLDAARWALLSILQSWRSRTDHVGVMLYGHRLALGTPEQGKLQQTRYLQRYPLTGPLEAFEDVETVLPPGRFGDQELSEVEERLQHLVPWGQTPLYLAVLKAVDELSSHANPVQRGSNEMLLDVIVVSDGRNYQFNPTPQQNISLEQVVAHARTKGVRVHVIGFGIESPELQSATAEFTQLADQTGGSVCMEVHTAVQLAERIDQITQPELFRVRLADGTWVASPVNVSIEVPTPTGNNTPIIVDYQRTTTLIPVNPDARIELSPASGKLVSALPMPQNVSRSALSTPEGLVSPFEIMMRPPRVQARTVQWQLGLQRRDEAVTQRPAYLWLELVPTLPAAASAGEVTYVVCDPLWQANTTNPVLTFETGDWPENAEAGQLKFWCSDRLPPPLLEFQCATADLTDQWLDSDDHHLADSSGVRYQVLREEAGIALVLLHNQPHEVCQLLPIIGDLPPQTRIERRYAPAQRISLHRFIHPQLSDRPGLKGAIYSTSDFKTQALRSGALEVPLHRPASSLPVGID